MFWPNDSRRWVERNGSLRSALGSKKYEKPLDTLFKAVMKIQGKLIKAIERVRKAKKEEYADLAGRQLTDMVCDVYMAHLLIDQARHSKRKCNVARKFIAGMADRFNSKLDNMKSLGSILGPE